MKLLLPGVSKRVYNLKDRQLGKLFSQLFGAPHDEVSEHLEQGDAAETAGVFFEKSPGIRPKLKSELSNQEVERFLERLSGLTREDDQLAALRRFAPLCTCNDFKLVVRLIKHDLRINSGAKHM